MVDNELLQTFSKQEQLSPEQTEQVRRYTELLISWNAKFNLTSITDVPHIFSHHFQDSWRLADFVDFSTVRMICDVGTGAGFPGLPLKIKFPHLKVILIEVNQKKIVFLKEVVQQLGLADVEFISKDWRTFLRSTDYPTDLVLARASLHPDQLVHMFKPSCPYKRAQLVYWASNAWKPEKIESTYLKREETYMIDDKKRKYIFFSS